MSSVDGGRKLFQGKFRLDHLFDHRKMCHQVFVCVRDPAPVGQSHMERA